MDIEFHYYMTYLIAARAGFSPAEATIIAQSSQGVDDNHIPVEVTGGVVAPYRNDVSQTMDITRPFHDTRIYPVFHFIPGDSNALSARRKDKKKHLWVTTPNGQLANTMLETAIRSENLYRVGASAHAYCDTWAHQNFVGKADDFNIVPYNTDNFVRKLSQGTFNSVLKIGHALAEHMPDLPGLVWQDKRLIDEIATISNRDRFADAAGHLFSKLYQMKHHGVPTGGQIDALKADIISDIGAHDDGYTRNAQRIENYKKRACTPSYGGTPIPEYDESKWFSEALLQEHGDIVTWLNNAVAAKLDQLGGYGDVFHDDLRAKCTWKDPHHFSESHWFKFQSAITDHLNECWGVFQRWAVQDAF